MNFIKHESDQKLRGGYYTPLDLATYITRWTLGNHPASVLEPSCGDGVFIQALSEIGFQPGLTLTGFELSAEESAKAQNRCLSLPSLNARIYQRDFLNWAIKQLKKGLNLFDAVIGNPPFIRYQYLPETTQKKAEAIFTLLNLPFSKHTNVWVAFVLAAIALLKPGGRLGMILPAEIIHIMHAQVLRSYLGQTCSRLLLIDPDEIWFEGTQQGAVILFAEKKLTPDASCQGLGIKQVSGRQFLATDPEQILIKTPKINGNTVLGKWTPALLSESERILLDTLSERADIQRFQQIAKVDVGLVTGANKFFLVSDATVARFGLHEFAHPMFGRSGHCPGIIYDESQHKQNALLGSPTNFIWLTDLEALLSKSVLEYIRFGEQQKYHTRYKCRIRKPWYKVPSVYATQIGMLKRSHDTPRLIYNQLAAYTTDTAYRISTAHEKPEQLIYSFLNSLTALSAELEGRYYGGGVLELVPSEIEKLLVPYSAHIQPDLAKLDTLVRQGNIANVLEQQNQSVLGVLGLPKSTQEQLLAAWLRLKNRRQRITDKTVD